MVKILGLHCVSVWIADRNSLWVFNRTTAIKASRSTWPTWKWLDKYLAIIISKRVYGLSGMTDRTFDCLYGCVLACDKSRLLAPGSPREVWANFLILNFGETLGNLQVRARSSAVNRFPLAISKRVTRCRLDFVLPKEGLIHLNCARQRRDTKHPFNVSKLVWHKKWIAVIRISSGSKR